MPSTLSCGVPQGSVLGPAQFVMYTEDLGELITDFSVLPLFFADDSQLLAFTTPSGVADVCRRLERCVSAVHDWCTRRRLQLKDCGYILFVMRPDPFLSVSYPSQPVPVRQISYPTRPAGLPVTRTRRSIHWNLQFV